MNMLGAVAKGVGNAVFGSNQDEDTAEQLLQRVSEGVLGEDRRQAMQELKDAMMEEPQWAMKVAQVGYPVLISVLREDKDDIELIKGTLEVFIACIEEQQASGSELIEEFEYPYGLQADYVTTILSLLDKEPVGVEDFYVRYYTLQISNMLIQANPVKLQESIVQSPNTVQSLVSLLSDRELVRNESLILLLQLCRKSDNAKILATQSDIFGRLLALISEENGISGSSVIVLDVLDLLHCLLFDNPQNQSLFCEKNVTQFIQLLDNQKTFDKKEIRGELKRLKPQTFKNLVRALDVFLCLGFLTSVNNNNLGEFREENVGKMREGNLGVVCVGLAFMCEGEGWKQVRMHALRCMSMLVQGNKSGREWLAHSVVYLQGGAQSLLLQVLRLAVSGESSEACLLIQAFFKGNENGVNACIRDLVAGSKGQDASELSEIILQGFKTSSNEISQIGSLKVVCAIINRNSSAASQAFDIQINDQPLFLWCKELFEKKECPHTLRLAILELWCYLVEADSENLISNYLLSFFTQQDQLIESFVGYIMGRAALSGGKQVSDETIQHMEFILTKYQRLNTIYYNIRFGIDEVDWPIDASLVDFVHQTLISVQGDVAHVDNAQVVVPPPIQPYPQISYQQSETENQHMDLGVPPPPSSPHSSVSAPYQPYVGQQQQMQEQYFSAYFQQPNLYEKVANQQTSVNQPTNGSKNTLEPAYNQPDLLLELKQQVKQQLATITHLQLQVEQKQTDIEVAQQEAQQHQQALKRLNESYKHVQSRAFELESKLQEKESKKGYNEDEVEKRIQVEVEKAQVEGEEAMSDLLVCLGEEEVKVAILSERLQELGEDPQSLLVGIKDM